MLGAAGEVGGEAFIGAIFADEEGDVEVVSSSWESDEVGVGSDGVLFDEGFKRWDAEDGEVEDLGDGFGGGDAEANAGVSAGALGEADGGNVWEGAVGFFAKDFDFVDEGFALCVRGVESVFK